MAETSIPASKDTLATLRDDKPEAMNWDEYLRALHEGAAVGGTVEVVDADEVRDAVASVEERVGRLEQTLEELGR